MKLMKFRLLAGIHQGPDYSQEPVELTDARGNTTLKYPSRIYQQGEVVEDKINLVERLGATKFQLLSGPQEDPPASPTQASSVAPGGQVSQGFQQTSVGPDGAPLSGPLTKEVRVPQPAQAKQHVKQAAGPDVSAEAPAPAAADAEQEYDSEGRMMKDEVEGELKVRDDDDEEDEEDEEEAASGKAEDKKAQSQTGRAAKEFKKADLDRMSASELKALAKKEGVDLKSAAKREDMIAAFKPR